MPAPVPRDTDGAVDAPGAAEPVVSGEVRSVSRALALLAAFGAERTAASLSDLARETGLATSTAQRLLQTLEGARFLARDAEGLYVPGSALTRLGLVALGAMPLRERAGPFLAALSAATRETVNLGVLDEDGRAMYVRQIPSPKPIRHESWLGRPFDPLGTAIGQALVGQVDRCGRFTTRRTHEPDVSGTASPIVGAGGEIVAAFSVTAPRYRTSETALRHLGNATAEAAREFTLALGGTWPWRSAPMRARRPRAASV